MGSFTSSQIGRCRGHFSTATPQPPRHHQRWPMPSWPRVSDGAYNRTLTPLGFQSERRDLWQAPQVYLAMPPFLYANNMTGALLM